MNRDGMMKLVNMVGNSYVTELDETSNTTRSCIQLFVLYNITRFHVDIENVSIATLNTEYRQHEIENVLVNSPTPFLPILFCLLIEFNEFVYN